MKICFATNNAKKLEEVKAALGDKIQIVSLREIGCTQELPETGDTLEHNAFQKAAYVKEHFGIDCFADDSGLEVDSLEGEPGVYSGRYAGEPRSDERNIDLLLKNLQNSSNRAAEFRTVIALLYKGEKYKFEGTIAGKILTERIGNGGFGYDPIFLPDGYSKSFGEFTLEEKNQISHRGKAVRKLTAFLDGINF